MDYTSAWREWLKNDLDIAKCTCNECDEAEKCQYAYDIYNIDGDCIMEK